MVNIIQIGGILLAILVLGFGAYRGIGALPITLLAGLVVIITNSMNMWEAISEFYMNGYLGFFKDYFLIFASSSLFAEVMSRTDSAAAIGYNFINRFGKDKVVLITYLVTAILTYGGVSLFVVVFAMTPIIVVLFREADIPMRFATGPLLAGSATFTMTSLPGTPALTNVIPSTFLGTTLTAAPWFSIIISIFMFVLNYIYLTRTEKRLRASGEHFEYTVGDASTYEVDQDKLPSAFSSFLPLIIVVGMIVGLRNVFTDSAQLVIISMIVATVVSLALNFNRISNLKDLVNKGLGGGIVAIAGPSAVVGFGTLVQASNGFGTVISWIEEFSMHPYVLIVLATALISGMTGSSSGGLRITMQIFADKLMASGVNLNIAHRLVSVAAGSLDSLPHSTSLFMTFDHLGLTHKDGYEFVFVTTVVVPMITTIIFTGIAVLFGL